MRFPSRGQRVLGLSLLVALAPFLLILGASLWLGWTMNPVQTYYLGTYTACSLLSGDPGAIFLCGRFEGLDQRTVEARNIEEISLGDFVLAGGEIAAMALIEASVRLLPGVLGAEASPEDESFSHGLLEYPQYTRPQSFEGLDIPEVLLGGNHAEIARWRREAAEKLTKTRRPDLWTPYEKSKR